MTDRVNLVLVALLAIVLGLGYALDDRGPTRAASGPVFPDFDGARAARVEIVRGDATVTLVEDDEGVWRIVEAFDLAAADGRVENNFLRRLAQLSRADQAGSERAPFRFEGASRVRVLDADGVALADFEQSVERRPPSGGSFISPAGEDAVFRSIALPVFEGKRATWWSSALSPGFDGIAQRLSLRLRTADGEVRATFERSDDGQWLRTDSGTGTDSETGAPRTVRSPVLVERVLGELGGLRFVDAVAATPEPGHGFDAPTAVFEIEGARGLSDAALEGRSLVITIGGQVEQHLLATSTARDGTQVLAIEAAMLDPVLEALAILLAE